MPVGLSNVMVRKSGQVELSPRISDLTQSPKFEFNDSFHFEDEDQFANFELEGKQLQEGFKQCLNNLRICFEDNI